MSEQSWEWVEGDSETLSLVQQRFGHDYASGLTEYLNDRWGSGWADSETGAQQAGELGAMLMLDELPSDDVIEGNLGALADDLVRDVAALPGADEFDPDEILAAVIEMTAAEIAQETTS